MRHTYFCVKQTQIIVYFGYGSDCRARIACRRFLIYRRQLGAGAVVLNLAGNVLAFVPFGLFLPLLVKRVRSFGKTVLLGFEFSLFVEILQLYSKVGSFDVDDILLNTTGVLIGYLLFCLTKIMHLHNKHKVSDKDR